MATHPHFEWLSAGDGMFPAMLAAIEAAQRSVCLEVYTFQDSPLAHHFRDALVRASERGASVRVLVDGMGSLTLPDSFWNPLRHVGGVVRVFNPLAMSRFWIRNHRKLLVCDEQTAFIGGFNIAPEYEGDGVHHGWCDVGLKLSGPLVTQLFLSFEEMFGRAEFKQKRFTRVRRFLFKKAFKPLAEQLLFTGPGYGNNQLKYALHQDLRNAQDVQLTMAYFLPHRRLRQDLLRVTRRGGRVQLVLPGKTDVTLSQLAAQSLYRRFLEGGVKIHEYQPQILHAKLIIVDDVVYVGSSNLDPRSLRINYELMLRVENKELAAQARQIIAEYLHHSKEVTAEEWQKNRTFWRRFKQRWAYFLLNRIDPYFARHQWRLLPR